MAWIHKMFLYKRTAQQSSRQTIEITLHNKSVFLIIFFGTV